jgi:hypothetical protein
MLDLTDQIEADDSLPAKSERKSGKVSKRNSGSSDTDQDIKLATSVLYTLVKAKSSSYTPSSLII